MSTLASLKKNSSLDKLKNAVKANQQSGSNRDDRFWQPEVDKAGNGYAVIRFLDTPAVDGEDGLPWVKLYTHGFQGPGGWYIENSRTTLGRGIPDPVSDYNSKLWESGIEANKELARKQKRRLNYISNILVVKDAAHPENEGKVFLFNYGVKIYEKLRQAFDPTPEEIDAAAKEGITLVPVNVFSFWEGHNFKLKIRKVEGYRNYDKSELEGLATSDTPAKGTPISKNDAAIEEIWKKSYSLKALVAPDQFKSYEELEARLNKVLGLDGAVNPQGATAGVVKSTPASDDDASPPFDEASVAASKKAVETKRAPAAKVETPAASADDSEMLNMFRELAEAD